MFYSPASVSGGIALTTQRPANDAYSVIPKLGELRDDVLFGDVWERPQLSKRDRSLITCAVLTALYRTEELKGHLRRALDNGVTQEELKEVILHVTFYSGWPTGVNAGRVAGEVFGA
jgi:4-carboxymuconolactone decarboxylase